MKKAIITGATGFIGSWLAQELLANGYEITVVVRERRKLLPDIADHAECRVYSVRI